MLCFTPPFRGLLQAAEVKFFIDTQAFAAKLCATSAISRAGSHPGPDVARAILESSG